jgi:hypothetical protein
MSPRRQRVALAAAQRNMMLLWLGYRGRVPQCELEGEAAPKMRRTYLVGIDVAFTKTDRSMAVLDAKRGAYRLLVDQWWHPALYPTRAAALAAGRKAEQAADARAAKALPAPAVLVEAREWARARDVSEATHILSERVAAGEIR